MNFKISTLGFFDVSDQSTPKELRIADVQIQPVKILVANKVESTTDTAFLLERTLEVLNSRKDRRENRNSQLHQLEIHRSRGSITQEAFEQRKLRLQKSAITARAVNMIDMVNVWAEAGIDLIFYHSTPGDVAGFFKEMAMFEKPVPAGFSVGTRKLVDDTQTFALLDKGKK